MTEPLPECGAEPERKPGWTPQRYLCTLAPGHEGDHYDAYGPLRWRQSADKGSDDPAHTDGAS